MHIRPRRDDDLQHLVRVLRRTHDEDGYPAHWPDDPTVWLTPPGHLAAWTAWSSGSVVGHVGLAVPDSDAAPLVTRLLVHPDHRGHGTADALLATAEGSVESPLLRLDVTEESPGAWRLYERRGWRMTHRSPADWAKPDGSVPVLRWYEKRLR